MNNLKKDNISFYSDGQHTWVLWQNRSDNRSALMFETEDDRILTEVFDMSVASDQTAMQKTLNSIGREWRKMAETGCDKSLIRNAVAALNYNKAKHGDIAELIELSRPIWQNNDDEPAPDPIPSPDI